MVKQEQRLKKRKDQTHMSIVILQASVLHPAISIYHEGLGWNLFMQEQMIVRHKARLHCISPKSETKLNKK